MAKGLIVKDLEVAVDRKTVVKGVSLSLKPGEIKAIMGPNGSGKSSLALAIAGHPNYKITAGQLFLDGKDLLKLKASERSLAGLFLGFQQPLAIPGVSFVSLMRAAWVARFGKEGAAEFQFEIEKAKETLEIKDELTKRSLNEGFSGGEKKRLEIAQYRFLKPRFAILDEPDTGLDIDALNLVSQNLLAEQKESPRPGLLLITHYQRLLKLVRPETVYVMAGGKIVETGGWELAEKVEASGYKELART